MDFNYYYGSQADQFSFIRIPKVMLTEKLFSPLSIQAKVLYGVLLDRMSLSRKNSWFDEENRVFIIYQIGEIQQDLGFTKRKAMCNPFKSPCKIFDVDRIFIQFCF